MNLARILIVFLFLISGLQASIHAKFNSVEEANKLIDKINATIKKGENVWSNQYVILENQNTIARDIKNIQTEIKNLQSNNPNSVKISTANYTLLTLSKQQEILKTKTDNPFNDIIEKQSTEPLPKITNPFLIFSGYANIKELESQQKDLIKKAKELDDIYELIDQKYQALLYIIAHTQNNALTQNKLDDTRIILQEFQSLKAIIDTSMEVFTNEIQSKIDSLKAQIKSQILRSIYILIAIIASFLIAFILKLFLRKYIIDDNRIYTGNKIINFFNITIIMLILLFAFIDNVTYIVAILGFASAGLAIAMKDWFMSILGYFVIVIGGSVHVGDRLKVLKDGAIYVGDVIDISMTRITIYEDVTLTSYQVHKRAGRIIFIPNNYIFTTLFANYSHAGMETVWDCVEYTITFDSNYQKALKISTAIAKKYSMGYTEKTKAKINKLKERYSLRNSNVETRAFCFIENNGIKISIWFQTNAYATLTLKSTISVEVIESILKEDDITITYPTTKVVPTGGDGRGNKPYFEPEILNTRQKGGPDMTDPREKDDIGIIGAV